jgi:hypothetical protein
LPPYRQSSEPEPRSIWKSRSAAVCQQLREAFSDSDRYRYVVLERDAKLSPGALHLLKGVRHRADPHERSRPLAERTGERWVGSARRQCFDHVIALCETHVRRIAREYVAYCHADRTHHGLDKDAASGRAIQAKPDGAELTSSPHAGGLHHRYAWHVAA